MSNWHIACDWIDWLRNRAVGMLARNRQLNQQHNTLNKAPQGAFSIQAGSRMNETLEVTSISSFMNWVKENTSTHETEQPGYALFYRGHEDENYNLIPSIYRINEEGKSHRDNESLMYHEMLRRDPDAFAKDTTVFERLARMQHHGLPTRLLDLTQNPLVALFFACEKLPEKNGQVMLFKIAQRDILHQQRLSKPIMAGIEYPLNFSRLGYDACNQLRSFIERENKNNIKHEELNDKYHNIMHLCITWIDKIINETHNFLFSCLILENTVQVVSDICDKWLTLLEENSKTPKDETEAHIISSAQLFIFHFLKRMREWQIDIINSLCEQMGIQYKNEWKNLGRFLRQLTFFGFVSPPINNERLRRQRGAFLICSPVQTDSRTINNFLNPIVIRIKAEAKEALQKELANQGMNRSYLFPELEEQAKDIQSIYPRQIETILQKSPQMTLKTPVSDEQSCEIRGADLV